MTGVAVGSTVAVLAVIGLVIGLVVLLVVIALLQGTLTPLRRILADLKLAKTAPMLERGIPGSDQLGQTRRLAESVPDLALAYLAKLSRGAPPPPPPAAPAAPAVSTPAPWTPTAPAAPPPQAPQTGSQEPAWKRFRG